MKLQKTKTLNVITLLLMLTFTTFMASSQTVSAADIKTYAYMAIVPNPVGVGQQVEVTIWIEPLPLTATDVFHDFTVTITKPDGTTKTVGPLTTSPVGMQYFTQVPDQIGTWYLQFNYAGEKQGNYNYLPCQSPKQELIVQQEKVAEWPAAQLPTDLWDRPINAENREWASIAGNWLMRGYNATNKPWVSGTGFNPYSQAPRSAHVAWTQEFTAGGLVGGEYGTTSYYAGLSYENYINPPIIMNGKLYYSTYYGRSGSEVLPGTVCVDLSTGEELWRNDDSTIMLGQLYNYISGNQMGVVAPYLWGTGSTYKMYDANSGRLILSFANASTGTVMYGNDGTMYVYVLNGQRDWLAMWNSTKAFIAYRMDSPTQAGLGQWRPKAGTYDWMKGVQWNVTIPNVEDTPDVPGTPVIQGITSNVIIAIVGTRALPRYYLGYSLTTGEELWRQPIKQWTWQCMAFGEGIFADNDPTTMTWHGYDANTGVELWESDPMVYPWGTFTGFGLIAYGKLFTTAYDGYVHAVDIKTGKEVWKFYSGDAGIETPYGTYPFYYGPIAAGHIVFAGTGEHSPTQPLKRGEKLFAIDEASGTGLWSISGHMVLQAIADGYLVGYNAYNNKIYTFGKGPSKTTVSAPQIVVPLGTGVMITGTVTDESAGQPGTPAIADADMSAWMEYVHMQKPIPGNARGVPVTLTAVGPDGGTINIGEVTSDMSGMFKKMWTPAAQGEYTIMATFAGSDSYGSSFGTTALGIGPASATPAPINAPTSSALSLPAEAVYAAAIVMVLLVIAVAVLAIRKK
ncbi:MAG: PQQ-binding-like beta-propeller repeat protein [Candidatus Bathyarchaeia archaeon]